MELDVCSMEGNRVRRAESVRLMSQFVFAPGRLLIVSSWCRWAHVVVFMGYFLFLFTRPVVEGNHSLMGGSADALHLGAAVHFFLLGPFLAFFLGFLGDWVSWVFYTNPLGACLGG